MLEEKNKRKEFEEVVDSQQKLGWHYYDAALAVARRCREARREYSRKTLHEPVALTEEEKQFDEEYKREMEMGCRMEKEEWDEIIRKKNKKMVAYIWNC